MKFARAPYLVESDLWRAVRLDQRVFFGILPLLGSEWSHPWLDVFLCNDTSELGFSCVVAEAVVISRPKLGEFPSGQDSRGATGLVCPCPSGVGKTNGSCTLEFGLVGSSNRAATLLESCRVQVPPGRLCVLSDNSTQVCALCHGRHRNFTQLALMRFEGSHSGFMNKPDTKQPDNRTQDTGHPTSRHPDNGQRKNRSCSHFAQSFILPYVTHAADGALLLSDTHDDADQREQRAASRRVARLSERRPSCLCY